MAQNLVLDVKLNQDSYTSNNTNGLAAGTGGMVRFTVAEYRLPTGSNFAAQLYQAPDGTYKIAYRGTVNPTGVGDAAMNAGIVAGRWTAEMGESVKFTLAAIQQVAIRNGISFNDAKNLFTLTGHSQGGFESELNAKFLALAAPPSTALVRHGKSAARTGTA